MPDAHEVFDFFEWAVELGAILDVINAGLIVDGCVKLTCEDQEGMAKLLRLFLDQLTGINKANSSVGVHKSSDLFWLQHAP